MAEVQRSSLTRVIASSLIGTTIEWYDFFLYGSAAALVFNKLFFPSFDPLVGTLLAFATYAVGFLARPLGGIVFGHFGDRIGRKRLLMWSLVMMGLATLLIGLLPGYDKIGIWAPIGLIVLRVFQGFAVGGEWGGAVLMAAEHGDDARRGFWSSWPQAGVPLGNLLATGVLFVLAAFQSDAQFEAWGWRIPFLLSAVLVLIGLYVRLAVEESPVFKEAQAHAAKQAATGVKESVPIVEVFRRYPREVFTAMGARFAENVSYYIFTIVITTYATKRLGLPSSTVLGAVLIGAAVHLITIPIWGALSDRFGRRPLYLFGAAGVGIWAFAFIALVNTRSFPMLVLAVVGGLLFHGAMYGPQAAFLSELFGTKVRYSGVSIGYQLASILAGGLAPLLAVWLYTTFDSGYAVSWYVAASAVVTILAVGTYHETRHRDLAADDGIHSANR